nr:receptor-like protein 12 [Ipomoea batatas]
MGTSLPLINHFLLTFLAFVVTGLCIRSGSNNTGICKEEEKQALLCFKEESDQNFQGIGLIEPIVALNGRSCVWIM